MTKKISINDDWFYSPNFDKSYIEETTLEGMEQVRLPHTNVEVPYHYFDESIYQFISCYKKVLRVSKDWLEKRIFITFEGVAHIAEVYVNGKWVGKHKGGYTSFTMELSSFLFEGDNILTVVVDSRECNNIPPFGKVVDYMTYGGIYREAWLSIRDQSYIEDVFVKTQPLKEDTWKLSLDLSYCDDYNTENANTLYHVEVFLKNEQESSYKTIGSYKTNSCKSNFEVEISNVQCWDIKQPNLYRLKVKVEKQSLESEDKEQVMLSSREDETEIRFGFRFFEFKCDGFYLNGNKVKIVGLNRHQSYPYVGYAMPKRAQMLDADILKEELGVNAVRTSHYPQSHHFIDRCDELGLLVFTEMPGWQYIGDTEWKEQAIKTVEEMVIEYRNHPSIILWGVRINESEDADEFYRRTNEVAHSLDSTRQTGGVRCTKMSNLLEDVYTYNDFSHNGKTPGLSQKGKVTPDKNKPYLVSECNGHMFPTKAFDCEAHRQEHAKRYLAVMESLFSSDEITGMFGWCMFDYNTHKDFGSGDRICYHGVMTMFRNEKPAAAVFSSQSDEVPTCAVLSDMNIGEHNGADLTEVTVLTNADSIRFYKNEQFIKEFYPDVKKYPHMPHPPIQVDDFVGDALEKEEGFSKRNAERLKKLFHIVPKYGADNMPLKYMLLAGLIVVEERLKIKDGERLFNKYINNWGGEVTKYRFDAIKDGELVQSVHKQPMQSVKLSVTTDTEQLVDGDTYDVASIRIKAVDENNNLLPYCMRPITLEVSGPIELIGPKTVSLIGGTTGTYIKSVKEEGSGTLTIRMEGCESITMKFTVKVR